MMTIRSTTFIVLLLLLLVNLAQAELDKKMNEKLFRDRNDNSGITKDEIIANIERRKQHLQKMLQDSKDKVARHLSGEEVFDNPETHSTLVKRIEMIGRKLERMEVIDEQELDRMHHREHRRAERRNARSEL